MTTFGDFYKPVKDFFGKVYVGANRVDLAGKNDTSKLTTFIEQGKGGALSGEFAVENAPSLLDDVKTKYKFTMNTGGRAIAKLTVTPKQVAGLELNLTEDFALDASGDSFEFAADFKKDPLTFTAALKKSGDAMTVDVSDSLAINAVKGLTVGGQGSYDVANGKPTKFAYGVQYKSNPYTVAATIENNKAAKGGFTVATTAGDRPLTVGAEAQATVGKGLDNVNVGLQTTLGSQLFKAKVNQVGACAIALQSTLNQGLKVSYGMEANLLVCGAAKAAVKVEYEG
eukprot:TRINITY_DN60154_c0_g1_i1.p2 TRINITY_DN60154_c0_g1~~TRINITY_DN60154_c0_g1_i1.p2  ORF type:complete len:284 (+),score=57.94 TRINITY_DN60154_c0_g1_i1:29-880(+)